MAFAVLGVLIGLTMASVVGLSLYAKSKLTELNELTAWLASHAAETGGRIEALEKRRHFPNAAPESEEDKFETPPRSMREVVRKAEAGEIPARRRA